MQVGKRVAAQGFGVRCRNKTVRLCIAKWHFLGVADIASKFNIPIPVGEGCIPTFFKYEG